MVMPIIIPMSTGGGGSGTPEEALFIGVMLLLGMIFPTVYYFWGHKLPFGDKEIYCNEKLICKPDKSLNGLIGLVVYGGLLIITLTLGLLFVGISGVFFS